jgi:hypothetical protein
MHISHIYDLSGLLVEMTISIDRGLLRTKKPLNQGPVPLVVPVVLLLCDKPWMKNGPGWDYDKRNKSVAICDTDIQ